MAIDQTTTANDNGFSESVAAAGEKTPLDSKIRRIIERDGPLSVASYMAHCLYDPEHGYYTTTVPFGEKGDFITAPEVSQMFGELIGIWCAATWQAMGSPDNFVLAEMGPGRGTLMADLLRAASTVPGFNQAADIQLVEVSPRLKQLQQQTLSAYSEAGFRLNWVDSFGELPEGPLILIANELMDALVFHQYEKTEQGWRERCIGLSKDDELMFVLGPGMLDEADLPGGHEALPVGAVFEKSPAREALAAQIADRLTDGGGAGLIVDYGHGAPQTGQTFQALERHAFTDPLTRCGAADLTSHVDFSALYKEAVEAGATATPPMEQGEFLVRMGLVERARQLGQDKSAEVQAGIRLDLERLAGDGDGTREGAASGGMGTLFKVMMIAQKGLLPPPFNASANEAAMSESDNT